MKKPKISFFLLLLMIAASFAQGADYVIPRTIIQVIDAASGQPAAGVRVSMLTQSGFMGDFEPITGEMTTNAAGQTVFPLQALKKFRTLSVSFQWREPGLPERRMVLELRVKKGGKVAEGRRVKLSDQKSGYVIDGDRSGSCDNLFKVEDQNDGLTISFRKPFNYTACEKVEEENLDVAGIGKRDINAGTLNFYKFEDDRRMGAEFFQEMEGTEENPPLKDEHVNKYVRQMVDRIVAASDMPELNFEVTVIDADIVNAFAVPGGFIFVYRGLIEATETEAELAGVIAHEIAHVTGRHGTEGITSAKSKATLATVLGQVAAHKTKDRKEEITELIETVVGSGTQFWIIGGTRKREAEADQLGLQYAWKAGYHPMGIATLFDRLSKQREKKQTRLDQFFSDHPNDEVRVASVTRDAGYFLPEKANLIISSPEYESVKRRLSMLPPPPVSGEAAGSALFSAFKSLNERILIGEIAGKADDTTEEPEEQKP